VLLNKRPANLSEQQRFNRDMWLDNEPEIALAYHTKEAFYHIYDSTDLATATKELDDWRSAIPQDMRGNFKELLSATKNWRHEILAYFDYPVTNGYTEALNGTAKVINRAGRGYSFDVLRVRVLFGKDRTKARKVKAVKAVDLYKLPEPPPAPCVAEEGKKDYSPEKSLRRQMLRREGNRCMSSKGIYEPMHLHVTRMGPFFEDEPEVNLALLCAECKRRFHTGEVDD
jgi:hypothetical protein